MSIVVYGLVDIIFAIQFFRKEPKRLRIFFTGSCTFSCIYDLVQFSLGARVILLEIPEAI